MKLKRALSFGMAAVLVCSGLSQAVVYGQGAAQEAVVADEADLEVGRTSEKDKLRTDITPGDADKPGTDATPGDADKPGTDATPGDADKPGTDATPGDADKLGEDGKPGTDTTPGAEPEKCNHKYQEVMQRTATCTMDGQKIFVCKLCGGGYVETTPALPHEYQSAIVKKARFQKDGIARSLCSVCGKEGEKTVIPAIGAVRLSTTEFVWDGSALRPSVVVLDKKGRELKEGTDYTLNPSNGVSTVGIHTINVEFQGNYEGTIGKIYRIIPKSVSIQKLTRKSKAFTMKWKKQDKEISGYEIQYSTSKKFTQKATKTVWVKNKKTTQKTIKKLKGRKTYYVRIRTYKKITINGKSKNIYAKWSAAKKVKTKK